MISTLGGSRAVRGFLVVCIYGDAAVHPSYVLLCRCLFASGVVFGATASVVCLSPPVSEAQEFVSTKVLFLSDSII